MPVGKIVTVPISEIRGSHLPFWWYRKYHSESGYVMLNEVGMDITFRKHYNHGVEIRFLDWFPETMLKEVLEFYVYLADLSLDKDMPDEAILSEPFNNLLVNMLKEGGDYVLPLSTVKIYERLLGISIGVASIKNVYEVISEKIRNKYRDGLCAGLML
jgi:hypothetical protein